MIKMDLPSIIDRYCIAFLKNERSGEDFSRELDMLSAEFSRYSFKKRKKIYEFITKLTRVHSDLWNTEASIRAGYEVDMSLEEVGRKALIVRDLNRIRQTIKNEMIDYFGDGFKDLKVNYGR